jgi:hypothetical protein
MRAASTYRRARRASAKAAGFPMAEYLPPKKHKPSIGDAENAKRNLEPIARLMLMTGPRSQNPSYCAIRKMVHYLLESPMHAKVPQHMRGSWRSWSTNIGRTA